MKYRLLLALLSAAIAGAAIAATPGDSPPTVVELFTSQGCSSCPPADALLAELAGRVDVVALAFHVNYWDRLGWRDRFATQWGTDRQRDYARSFVRGRVYTPQMIVNGTAEMVGSRVAEVSQAIVASQDRAAERLPVRLGWNGGVLTVSLPRRNMSGAADVWAIRYIGARQTRVLRGENGGRTLRDANIAQQIERLGGWSGEAVEFTLRVAPPRPAGDGIAVLVQRRGPGEILGAAKVTFAE